MANAKVGGTWRTIRLPYTRISGTWRPCKQVYAKVGGVWKIVFDITQDETFDGSGSLSGALTPGYAPWEVLSGTWTKSGGSVSASDASSRSAALLTGTENVEVEIDRPTVASGGDGVAFWIQDQSNWWGVRAYTEQYYVPFTNYTFYPYNCTDTYTYRAVTLVPGNTNTGNIAGYNWTSSQPFANVTANSNRYNSTETCRTCSCTGTLNSNCSFGGLFAGPTTCPFTGACATVANYANATCTVNTKGTFCRVSSCGGVCGSCTPTSSYCPTGSSFYGSNVTCPPTGSGSLSSGQCTCTYPTYYSCTAYFNAGTTNPATCSCSDTFQSSSNYVSFVSTNQAAPTCPSTSPCGSSFYYTSRTCSPCSSGCTFSYSGANVAYYKRGQIIRQNAGSLSVITNQDFGDVGNLYAYTSGNVIGFRQYSAAGKTGTVGNLVTYDAGAVTKGSKHGIIVTAVPYTQSYSISRFKVTI